jgi:hypothetical protein
MKQERRRTEPPARPFQLPQQLVPFPHGNAPEWVYGVYQDILGRAPDLASLQVWLQFLQEG